jgi:hypothetical protein
LDLLIRPEGERNVFEPADQIRRRIGIFEPADQIGKEEMYWIEPADQIREGEMYLITPSGPRSEGENEFFEPVDQIRRRNQMYLNQLIRSEKRKCIFEPADEKQNHKKKIKQTELPNKCMNLSN